MTKFYTGFARVSVTPDFSVPLSGYGNDAFRMSTTVLDEAELNCYAAKDFKGNIVIMYTFDACTMNVGLVPRLRETVGNAVGIPAGNVFICNTHSHSGPSTNAVNDNAKKWIEEIFIPGLVKGAKDAISDFDETEIFIGSGVIDQKFHFVRRYRTDIDQWRSIAQSDKKGKRVAHETFPDDDFLVIKFKRANKKDIILTNWAAHACFNDTSKSTQISADYPRYVRTFIEEDYDCHSIFFQGASGNVVTRGMLEGEKLYNVDKIYARDLVDAAKPILENMKKVESGEIKCADIPIELMIDHSKDDMAEKAKIVYDLYCGNHEEREKGTALCPTLGFDSIYDARDVLQKSRMGKSNVIYLYAVSFGDVSFACPSYEMFDTNGMEIKGASPFEMTFICEITNGYNSYIPSYLAYPHGGYEVSSCKYKRGCGEQCAYALITELNKMKG